jgi:glycine/D-amino acid oxidase-like deaminating enzyme
MSMSSRNIVVVGGGIQGTSVAYHLAKADANTKITILEAKAPASAASGKGGGFMARSWGDGSPTQTLHHVAFDLYETLAPELGCKTYRKLPVLSVNPGGLNAKGLKEAKKNANLRDILPGWLDGSVGRISAMGYGDDTAQITPSEFVDNMLKHASDQIDVVLGTCCGVDTEQGSERASRKITGVKYVPRGSEEETMLPADAVIVSAGPWSCAAEDWFQGAVQLPMEGIKSTSIVWKKPEDAQVDGTALFCGEDDRFGTHCKCNVMRVLNVYWCQPLSLRFSTRTPCCFQQWRCILVQMEQYTFVVLVDPITFPRRSYKQVPSEKSAMPKKLAYRRPLFRFRK